MEVGVVVISLLPPLNTSPPLCTMVAPAIRVITLCTMKVPSTLTSLSHHHMTSNVHCIQLLVILYSSHLIHPHAHHLSLHHSPRHPRRPHHPRHPHPLATTIPSIDSAPGQRSAEFVWCRRPGRQGRCGAEQTDQGWLAVLTRVQGRGL